MISPHHQREAQAQRIADEHKRGQLHVAVAAFDVADKLAFLANLVGQLLLGHLLYLTLLLQDFSVVIGLGASFKSLTRGTTLGPYSLDNLCDDVFKWLSLLSFNLIILRPPYIFLTIYRLYLFPFYIVLCSFSRMN